MDGNGNELAVIAVGGAASTKKNGAGEAIIGDAKRSRASRKADREHRRAARCYRWRQECSAEKPEDGTFEPQKPEICNLAVAEECRAFFEYKKILAVSRKETKQRANDHVLLPGEQVGLLSASLPNDSGTAAALEGLKLAGLGTGPWRVAVGGSAAGWAVGVVAVSIVRKVRQWCRRRRQENEENQRYTAAVPAAAAAVGCVPSANDIESGKVTSCSSLTPPPPSVLGSVDNANSIIDTNTVDNGRNLFVITDSGSAPTNNTNTDASRRMQSDPQPVLPLPRPFAMMTSHGVHEDGNSKTDGPAIRTNHRDSAEAIEVIAPQPLSPRLAMDSPQAVSSLKHAVIAVPVSDSLVEMPPAGSMCGVVQEDGMVVSDNDSSCGADFMNFELEDGELLEASSFIPVSIKSKTDVRPRKWTPENLMSTADGGCARVIGWGSFAKVAVTTLSNNVRIAVKAIERVMPETNFCQDELIDGELKYLTMCAGHPSVVDCLGYLKTTLRVYVMMPLVPSNLEAILENLQGGSMNEDDTKGYMRQVGSALEYLHCKGIIHRDIKPANVLVNEDKTALLADFGVSTTIPEGETHVTELCGTKSYFAPEQLPEDPDDLAYGTEVDMWAFGVLTYELLTGDTPFRPSMHGEGNNGDEEPEGSGAGTPRPRQGIALDFEDMTDAQERLNILNAGVSFGVGFGSKECIDFVSKLLQRNISSRMSASKAAEHPWLGGLTEAAATRARVSAALDAREQELKQEKAKILTGRRRVRVRTATVKKAPTAEDA